MACAVRILRLLPLIAALSLLDACCETSSGSTRPNVLVVVMDTTRGDRVSMNGFGRPTTPRLDAFARDAIVYLDAWSPAGWTGPAHASLFTGLRLEHHGFFRGNREYLDARSVTLAERFREAGYLTACLTNNDAVSPSTGLVQGFDRQALLYLDEAREYPWAPETHRQALECVDEARREGSPFFVFVNDMEPHYPYTPAPEFEGEFVAGGVPRAEVTAARDMHASALFVHNLGAAEIPPDRMPILSDLYDAEIATLDDAIGDLLDALRDRDILDDTIVVIAGDHGEEFGEHGFVGHMFSLHRSIRHVPLLVRYPPMLEGGRRVADTVRLEDVAPTVLELAGLVVPPDLDGRSLLRDLPDRVARAVLGPPSVFLDRVGPAIKPGDDLARLRVRVHAVYDGRFHLIRYSDGREELYDLASDLRETRNLALSPEDHADVLSRLRPLLPAP